MQPSKLALLLLVCSAGAAFGQFHAATHQEAIERATSQMHTISSVLKHHATLGGFEEGLERYEIATGPSRKLLVDGWNENACQWSPDAGVSGTCIESPELARHLFSLSTEEEVVPLLSCIYMDEEKNCKPLSATPEEYHNCVWTENPKPGVPKCSFHDTRWFSMFAACLPEKSIFHNLYKCLSRPKNNCSGDNGIYPCVPQQSAGSVEPLCIYNVSQDSPSIYWAQKDPLITAEAECLSTPSGGNCGAQCEPSSNRPGTCEVSLQRSLEILVDQLDDGNHGLASHVCRDYMKPLMQCMIQEEQGSCNANDKCEWDTPEAFQYAVAQFELLNADASEDNAGDNSVANNDVSKFLKERSCTMSIGKMLDYYFPSTENNPFLRKAAAPLEKCYELGDADKCRKGVQDGLTDDQRRALEQAGRGLQLDRSAQLPSRDVTNYHWAWVFLIIPLALLLYCAYKYRIYRKNKNYNWAKYAGSMTDQSASGYVPPDFENPTFMEQKQNPMYSGSVLDQNAGAPTPLEGKVYQPHNEGTSQAHQRAKTSVNQNMLFDE